MLWASLIVPESFPLPPLAQLKNNTPPAFRFAGGADITAVQDEPVVGVFFILFGDEFQQPLFDFQDVFPRRQAGAVGYPEDVGVHGDGGLAERGVEDDVGGFPAYSRQLFQRFPVGGDFPGMVAQQDVTGFDDIFGLCVVKSD